MASETNGDVAAGLLSSAKVYRAWHNYYPTLAYARNDPKTFYVAIDHAARMAGMNQCGFYNRYLLSKELPYVVMLWCHGKGRGGRSPSFRVELFWRF